MSLLTMEKKLQNGVWMGLLGVLALLATARPMWAQSHGIVGQWAGQVGEDRVGPYSEIQPNGIQDICIVLDGLPPAREIAWAKISGDGGSEWQYNGGHGPYAIALQRQPGGTRGVMFVEPDRVETGRAFFIDLRFDSGETVTITVAGGRADPRLRTPGQAVLAEFLGNTGDDLTGHTPAVGPDGVQDVVIRLRNLPDDTNVARVRILADRTRWETGLNPDAHLNAEFVVDKSDPTTGLLYFQPARTLRAAPQIEITYANNAVDRVTTRIARHSAVRPVAPPPTVSLTPAKFAVRWHGQEGKVEGDRGDVHLSVAGLPRGQAVVAAGLSDAAGGYWAWRANDHVPFDISQWDRTLRVIQDVPGGRLALFFPPFRDESGASMSLWLLFEDGRMTFTPFEGQSCDPFLYGQPPAGSTVTANPGDDLQSLVRTHGTVNLSPGVYRLTEPLVLDQPVTVAGGREAIIEFAQEIDIPWTSAIKIHRSNTALSGFTVRFATPITWRNDDQFAPAVIGSTDRGETDYTDPKRNITIEKMRIISPESADPSQLAESPRLLHFATAANGRIIGNEMRGGMVELVRGPWIVRDNVYLGCQPGFWAWDFITTRWTHDVIVENNHLRPLPDSGKTWRFLVFAAYGFNNVVRNNTVAGIGVRDDDTIPNPNAAEIVLTEAYTVKFEGRPAAIREGGRILQLPLLHADTPRSGDAVVILTGEHAGKWFPIAQQITPTVLLMDQPLPAGEYVISIATGFTNLIFEGNRIDSTGSSTAGNLILVGNHFGTIVRNNHLIGGGAFKLAACPTERPNIWGWTHCPYVGDVVEGNIFEDSGGAMFGVEYGAPIKTTRGRTYRAGVFRNNVFRYTADALHTRSFNRHQGQLPALAISDRGGLDPVDAVIVFDGNVMQAPPDASVQAAVHVRSATLNGQALTDHTITLPIQPAPVAADGGTP